MSTLLPDYAFGGSEKRPVHAEYNGESFQSPGIAFEDYVRMQTQRHKLARNRREQPPDWVFSTSKLRLVILRCIEQRAYVQPRTLAVMAYGTEQERLARAQQILKARRPALEAQIGRLCREYVAAKNAGDMARVRFLGPKIEECDTGILMLDDAPKMLTGVVYFYYHCGLDSVAVGQQLHVKPPHVRQMIWRLKKCAGELGFGPQMIVQPRPETIAKRKARQLFVSEKKKAQQFARLIKKGMSWGEAKAVMNDDRPNHHYWRRLCAAHGVELVRRQTARVRPPVLTSEQAHEAADLRKHNWTYARIGKKFGVGIMAVRYALQRTGLYVPVLTSRKALTAN